MGESDDELLVRTEAGVRHLTLNRPERLNALSRSLEARLIEAMLAADVDPDVRVIVLGAAGDRAFCSGFDLKDLAADDSQERPFYGPMHSPQKLVYEVIAELGKPTIAALNGVTVGAGFELALACDLRIGVDGMRFGLPEAKRGMGAVFASVVLPRRIPMGIALEMMFTGEFLDADTAYRFGLLNRIVPFEDLEPTVSALAAQIAANAPLSVQRMKAMAVKGASLPVAAALRLDVGPNPYTSQDRLEGIRAFVERRPPVWKGC